METEHDELMTELGTAFATVTGCLNRIEMLPTTEESDKAGTLLAKAVRHIEDAQGLMQRYHLPDPAYLAELHRSLRESMARAA